IVLDDPIKAFGMHEVPIKLHPQVTGRVFVLVKEA
ncbi:MAG: 50S ribosomal protein L9, partial [Lachnospiraceae bacterium]|nr:50S ribosomal protein L9 [Lachnospiraceae bacterium]